MNQIKTRIEAQAAAVMLKATVDRLKTWVETAPAVTPEQLNDIRFLLDKAHEFTVENKRISLPAEDIGAANQSEWEGKRLGNALKFDPSLSGAELTKLGREKLSSMSLTQAQTDAMPLGDRRIPVETFLGKSIG